MAEYEIKEKKQVLARLGIQDWRYLTQDHYMELVGMMDKMDPATRSFVQNQLIKTAADSVKKQQTAALSAIEQNSEIGKKALDVSKATIKALEDIALSEMSEEEKDKWADRVLKANEDAMKQADETKNSNNKAVTALTAVSAIALLVAGACLGAKVDLSKVPKLISKMR